MAWNQSPYASGFNGLNTHAILGAGPYPHTGAMVDISFTSCQAIYEPNTPATSHTTILPHTPSKKSRSSTLAHRSTRRKTSAYDRSPRKEKSVEEALKKFETLSLSRSSSFSSIASSAGPVTPEDSLDDKRRNEISRLNNLLRTVSSSEKREKILRQILCLRTASVPGGKAKQGFNEPFTPPNYNAVASSSRVKVEDLFRYMTLSDAGSS